MGRLHRRLGWFENQIEQRRKADDQLLEDSFVRVAGVVLGHRTAEKLCAADLDPEIIRTIRYQVEKVTEAGGIPEKKESVLGKLERYKKEEKVQKRLEKENGKPGIDDT